MNNNLTNNNDNNIQNNASVDIKTNTDNKSNELYNTNDNVLKKGVFDLIMSDSKLLKSENDRFLSNDISNDELLRIMAKKVFRMEKYINVIYVLVLTFFVIYIVGLFL